MNYSFSTYENYLWHLFFYGCWHLISHGSNYNWIPYTHSSNNWLLYPCIQLHFPVTINLFFFIVVCDAIADWMLLFRTFVSLLYQNLFWSMVKDFYIHILFTLINGLIYKFTYWLQFLKCRPYIKSETKGSVRLNISSVG